MKKLLLLFLLVPFIGQAQVTLFEDDFETYTATDNVGEDTDIPATYMSYDVDGDGYNWGLAHVDNFSQPFSDYYVGNFMISASYITTGAGGNGGQGALSPNNILVLPMMSIPEYSADVVLSLLVGSGTDPDYFSEHYSVIVTTSSDQADILAATPVLETTLAFQGAEFINVPLDGYAGQDIYVSLRHFDTTDEFLLCVDNLQVQYTDTSSVEDLEAHGFSYYPNPVNDVLNLSANTAIDQVEILNVLGQKIYVDTPNTLQQSVDFSDLQSGIYLVNVAIDGSEGTFKIVKK